MNDGSGPDAPFRPDLYVVARFLDRLDDPGVVWTRSSLQTGVRLNYDQFRRYLDFLQRRGWVAIGKADGRSPRITLTASGRDAWTRLLAWIEDLFARPPS
jgi:predicted transcriptional regulator